MRVKNLNSKDSEKWKDLNGKIGTITRPVRDRQGSINEGMWMIDVSGVVYNFELSEDNFEELPVGAD